MDRINHFNAFEFDNQRVFDQQIDAVTAFNGNSFVFDGKR
jgi:hypothetical protein